MARTGRPRTFDAEEALAHARDLFWSRGYGATSIQDLVDELDVQRGSLYAAFGDKRSLYLKAVALYEQENHERLQTILAEPPVLPKLRQMLLTPASLTQAPDLPRGDRRGCLLGNTVAELVPGDDAAQSLVAAAYAAFVDLLTSVLARAQAAGEVATSATPQAQAELLLLVFQGSALVGRTRPEPERLAAAVDVAIDALRAHNPVNRQD